MGCECIKRVVRGCISCICPVSHAVIHKNPRRRKAFLIVCITCITYFLWNYKSVI
nr:MAG TPA: hypothetical protein [Caudoviricetes sp.]